MWQVPAEAWNWIQRGVYLVARTPLDPASLANPLRTVVGRRRTRRSALQCEDDGGTAAAVAEQRAIQHAAAEHSRRDRRDAGGGRDLRSHRLLRKPPNAGDRRPHGARRNPRDVVRLVVRQAAVPIAIGLLLGIAASFAATRVLSAQLFGVTASDPLTFVIVAVGLGFVGLLASVIPARRAAGVDPTRALHMN